MDSASLISARLRQQLETIAGRVPDGDETALGPLVATVGLVYVGPEDAEELCSSLDLAQAVDEWHRVFGAQAAGDFLRALVWLVDVAQDYRARYGVEAGERMLRNLVALLGAGASVETVDIVERVRT